MTASVLSVTALVCGWAGKVAKTTWVGWCAWGVAAVAGYYSAVSWIQVIKLNQRIDRINQQISDLQQDNGNYVYWYQRLDAKPYTKTEKKPVDTKEIREGKWSWFQKNAIGARVPVLPFPPGWGNKTGTYFLDPPPLPGGYPVK
jgi:hypothetical protein